MGLLGFAFDPDYGANGAVYVNYTEGPVTGPWFTVVARYLASGDPDVADPNSEERILRIGQPESNHNGGMLAFGPDGYLYIFTGDGGGGGDQHGTCGNGQSRTTLLGKLLRIDVRGPATPSRRATRRRRRAAAGRRARGLPAPIRSPGTGTASVARSPAGPCTGAA